MSQPDGLTLAEIAPLLEQNGGRLGFIEFLGALAQRNDAFDRAAIVAAENVYCNSDEIDIAYPAVTSRDDDDTNCCVLAWVRVSRELIDEAAAKTKEGEIGEH